MSQQTFIRNQNAATIQRDEDEEILESDFNKLCYRSAIMLFLLVFFLVTSLFIFCPAQSKNQHLSALQEHLEYLFKKRKILRFPNVSHRN